MGIPPSDDSGVGLDGVSYAWPKAQEDDFGISVSPEEKLSHFHNRRMDTHAEFIMKMSLLTCKYADRLGYLRILVCIAEKTLSVLKEASRGIFLPDF